MVFLQLFKTLEGKIVTVELMNNVVIKGKLVTTDQFFNFRLEDIEVLWNCNNLELNALTSVYLRGSTVRYMLLSKEDVDLELLRDATRRHNQGSQ
ncbi:U6 snRNA-associated Sm-like protein LSm2 [Tritrichomonas musculus]|uniref:U6 snRNA-associated Sm-like protein LSm2 n=1 Tax=Tritrichomonas musculus TaxID=1915356 RepID=A0ABR2KTH8_9EUKA